MRRGDSAVGLSRSPTMIRVIFLEYAVDTARACHDAGLKTVAVTAGYITPEARSEFYADIDAANVDLKGFNQPFYRNLCGGRWCGSRAIQMHG
jgi:pyruvate-formate lyase-activating enzyme